MPGIAELLEKLILLTTNVQRLQNDVKALDGRYEKLHEQVTQLRVNLAETL